MGIPRLFPFLLVLTVLRDVAREGANEGRSVHRVRKGCEGNMKGRQGKLGMLEFWDFQATLWHAEFLLEVGRDTIPSSQMLYAGYVV